MDLVTTGLLVESSAVQQQYNTLSAEKVKVPVLRRLLRFAWGKDQVTGSP